MATEPKIVNREVFYASMRKLKDENVKDMLILLFEYIGFIESKAIVRDTNMGIKLDTVIAVSNATTKSTTTKRVRSVGKAAEKPGDKRLFDTKPNSRMGNKTIAKMLHLGDQETKAWVMENIPKELANAKHGDYINEEAQKAVDNTSEDEKSALISKYRAGYIYKNMDKNQRATFYKNIENWWNAHRVKYDTVLEKEGGNADTNDNVEENEDDNEEEKVQVKPVKAPRKPAVKGEKKTGATKGKGNVKKIEVEEPESYISDSDDAGVGDESD